MTLLIAVLRKLFATSVNYVAILLLNVVLSHTKGVVARPKCLPIRSQLRRNLKSNTDLQHIIVVLRTMLMLFNIHYIRHVGVKQAYTVKLELNKHDTKFEIDTGSRIMIISMNCYRTYFTDIPSNIIVKTYSEENLHVLGEIYVEVCCNGKIYPHMNVFVLKGGGVNLLGRNWLNVMQMDWNSVIRPTEFSIFNKKTSDISNETERNLNVF